MMKNVAISPSRVNAARRRLLPWAVVWPVLVSALLMGLTLTACGAKPDLPYYETMGSLTSSTQQCWFNVPRGALVNCGVLHVREQRWPENDNEAHLAVAVLRSTSSAPSADPVVILAGGPGLGLVQDGASWLTLTQGIRSTRDVILVDPRGTGNSKPLLGCPGASTNAIVQSEITACRNNLHGSGLDLTAYDTQDMAADIADLATALGYDQVNLMGQSYGSRVAQRVVRDYPQVVRSAVLDGALPLNRSFLLGEAAANGRAAFDFLAKACTNPGSTACNQYDLSALFADILDDLNDNRLTQKVGDDTTVVWGVDQFVSDLRTAMYRYENIESMGRDLSRLSNNRTFPTHWYSKRTTAPFSLGAYLSAVCHDIVPLASLTAENHAGLAYPAFSALTRRDGWMREACRTWGVGAETVDERQPLQGSQVPLLVVSSVFDPVTPLAWGDQIIGQNPAHSLHIWSEEAGHGVFAQDNCARAVVASFLRGLGRSLDGCSVR